MPKYHYGDGLGVEWNMIKMKSQVSYLHSDSAINSPQNTALVTIHYIRLAVISWSGFLGHLLCV